MKRSAWFVVTAALLLAESVLTAAAAGPAGVTAHSALELPGFDAGLSAAGEGSGAPSLAAIEGIRELSVRRRPRARWRAPSRSHRHYGGFSQLHGGFYDPEDAGATGALFGFRGGTDIDQNLQIGAGIDWSHRSDNTKVVVSEEPLPGGGATVRRLELARSSSDLLPFMAFLQLTPGGGSVRPYFGIGGGYEVLFVSAEDFATGLDYDATFGGWGWQAWGGLSFPFSGSTSLNVEVYSNQAELSRDLDDPVSGLELREIVDADGKGMRFGLSWGF